jgi:hypothetical protein
MSAPGVDPDGWQALVQRLERAESRLRCLEDERDIRELLARYGHYADACRDHEYVDLFADDGAIDISMGGDDGDYARAIRFEGKQALWAFITDPHGHHRPGFYGRSLHVQNTNTVIRVDGDEAVANTYSILLQQNGADTRIVGAGTNRWTFRRVDGRWLVTERRRRELGHPDTAANLSVASGE